MPPERYAVVREGRLVWGPGPLPHLIALENGDLVEAAAHGTDEREAAGLQRVEQRGWREIDPEIEQACAPGVSVENGRAVETWTYVFTPGARAAMRQRIDERAEALRDDFITPGSGQALEYDNALREAKAVMALPIEEPISPGRFPFLEADLHVTAFPGAGRNVETIREAAAAVLGAHRRWSVAAAAIRAKRLSAKAAVAGAESDEAAFRSYLVALRELSWP